MKPIIALDGPAASGKSTLAKKFADEYNYLFFDTGVMYRAVTLAVIENGVSPDDEQACTRIANEVQIDVRPASIEDDRTNDILLNGVDKTWEIRKSEVEANVSKVAAYSGVRSALTMQQRRIGLQGNVVMVGRDIGTVVLPEANIKIYLDASAEERARRRFLENQNHGTNNLSYEEILASIKLRDDIDKNRKVAPLKIADDAIVINSDEKTIDEVYEELKAIIL
jgi:CMP/dCMP kinase